MQTNVSEPTSAAEKLRQKFRQLSRLGSEVLGTPRSTGKENEDGLESASKRRITNYNDGELMTVPQVGSFRSQMRYPYLVHITDLILFLLDCSSSN